MKKIAKIIITVLTVVACLIPAEAKGQWKKDGKGWWYERDEGYYYSNIMLEIDGEEYVFDSNGYMRTDCWSGRPATDDPSIYYFKSNGAMARSQWVGNCWVSFYGGKRFNQWVDNGRYYVDNNGNWDPSKGTRKTGWKKDSKGWYFDQGDGTRVKNALYEIDKNMYYFDIDGYMKTGWIEVYSQSWYYFGSDGAMYYSRWQGNYYLGMYGSMQRSKWVDHEQYFVGEDGKWVPNAVKEGWQKDSKGWWYSNGYGGYYKDGEYYVGGKIYFFGSDGYLKTGWFEYDGKWRYSDSSGVVYKNRWVGDYWLKGDGYMAVSQWVDGGKYYVGADGKWIPDYKK